MVDDERSNNGDNELGRLPPLRGRLGHENDKNDLDRLHPLREHLTSERTSVPSCIRNPNHPITFHFRNGIIGMLP